MAAKRPNWLTKRKDGSIVVEGATRKEDTFWLNPFHPQVQQFILDLIVEIVSQYPVKGIQFDDHFALATDFGYDAYTTQLYKQENGGKMPPADAKDPSWMSWRAKKLTDFMQRVFWVVKEYNSKCIISHSAKALTSAYTDSLQDWQTWHEYGLIEELVLQNYQQDLTQFTAQLERPEVQAALRHIPVSVGVLTGLKTNVVAVGQLKDQVKAVRDRKFNGVSFFFYETLVKVATETQDGKLAYQAIFPASAERPGTVTA